MRRHLLLPILLTAAGCPSADGGDDLVDSEADSDAGETDDTTDDTDPPVGDTDPAELYDEACPEPQAINTICIDLEGYGSRVLTVTMLNGGQGLARGPARTSGNDAVNIQHAPAGFDLDEGTQDCAGLWFVNVYLSDGAGGSVTWTTEEVGGSCSLVTTTGGNWDIDELAGTFTATLVHEDDEGRTRDISGSFRYLRTEL